MQESLNLDQTQPLHKTSVMQSVISPQDLRVGNIVASGFMNQHQLDCKNGTTLAKLKQ